MQTKNKAKNEQIFLNSRRKEIPGNPSTAKSSSVQLRKNATSSSLRVLSKEDWEFWNHNGYIVVKHAVSQEQIDATVNFLWEFDDKDPNNPKTWYSPSRAKLKMKELIGIGMVEAYNHQCLWNNRQTQKVYDAFVDIWGEEKLWVTIDRANLNVPSRVKDEYKGFIHWDYDPETKPQNVQGVLALSDQTDERVGGFQCIPWCCRSARASREKQ